MAIKLMNTNDVGVHGVKLLVHGVAGAGKTTLIATLPKPLVLSAEAGLLSIADSDIPFIDINTLDDLKEAYAYALEHKDEYESICLDSISEIGEVVLSAEKKKASDPRQAYGAMQEQMGDLIRAFRDLSGVNVYFSAKTEKSQDDLGKLMYAPSMPGNKMGQQLPYFFDEVLALRVEKDADGNVVRGLQTSPDGVWSAKDRSGKLEMWEAPDLGAVIKKIIGGQA
jgi:phage nucleotide-binding protein